MPQARRPTASEDRLAATLLHDPHVGVAEHDRDR